MNSTIKRQLHPLVCQRTGIKVGLLQVDQVAGYLPLLSQWKETLVHHPIFSLPQTALLNFAKSSWNHFCSLSPEEAADEEETARQEKLLQVAVLALLHQLTSVQQTTVWLPSLQELSANWSSLLQLAYWKASLESKRFKFPELRITKLNKGLDLRGFLQACWDSKKQYESRVRELSEEDSARKADAVLKAIKDELAGKAPRSKKLLWRWFCHHLGKRYYKDMAGWMEELYNAETESEIAEFTIADIDLFEEIFLCEVPLGSTISNAFLQRIKAKRELLVVKFDTFEILIPDAISAAVSAGNISTVEPKAADFPTKVAFIIAHAKWKLGTTDTNKHLNAARNKQSTVTVKASHIPSIKDYLGRNDEDDEWAEESAEEHITALDAAASNKKPRDTEETRELLGNPGFGGSDDDLDPAFAD